MFGRLITAIRNDYRTAAPARFALVTMLSLSALILSVSPSGATIGAISKADLSGPWAATMTGDTGCGVTTVYFTFTLNTSGSGSGTAVNHTSGCGDSTSTNTFTITSLNANGSGTANYGCGTSCGFNLNIQVAPDRSVFNLVDVSRQILATISRGRLFINDLGKSSPHHREKGSRTRLPLFQFRVWRSGPPTDLRQSEDPG